MQIMIATDGNLDAEHSSRISTARLVQDGDTVSLATAVEVPRTLLTDSAGLLPQPPPPHTSTKTTSTSGNQPLEP